MNNLGNTTLQHLLFIASSLLLLSSCSVKTTQGSKSQALYLPSVGASFSSADSELFYVDLDVDAYESKGEKVPYYEINTTEQYGDSISRNSPSNCEIAYQTPADRGNQKDQENTEFSKSIICILDVPEWAFTLKDLNLVFNVPEKMCESVRWSLPWHFNFKIQPGPRVLTCPIAEAPTASAVSDQGNNNQGNNNQGTGSSPTPTTIDYFCDLNTYIESTSKTIADGTVGNLTGTIANPMVPKDCPPENTKVGEITNLNNRTTKAIASTSNEALVAASTRLPYCQKEEIDLCVSGTATGAGNSIKCCYGGNKASSNGAAGASWLPDQECFAGPALVSQIDPNQFYVNQNTIIGKDGLKQPITLKKLLDISGRPHNTHHANYIKELDLSFKDLVSRRTNLVKSLPVFLQKSNYIHTPNLFFKFSCLDSAHEILHEILLLVREWNTLEEFLPFYTSGGANESRSDPDVEGLEGTACSYENRYDSPRCNDWRDLADYKVGDPNFNNPNNPNNKNIKTTTSGYPEEFDNPQSFSK